MAAVKEGLPPSDTEALFVQMVIVDACDVE
jgi:hypothetical protein